MEDSEVKKLSKKIEVWRELRQVRSKYFFVQTILDKTGETKQGNWRPLTSALAYILTAITQIYFLAGDVSPQT